MKSFKFVLVYLAICCTLLSSPMTVFATSKTDYDYQWAKYRENYAEFTLLKQDYLINPTLDNQQKAILSAKQTILARDMAKSSYAKYLMDLIASQNTGYKDLDPIVARLSAAATYFYTEAQLSQQVITPADLKKFALDYYNTFPIHDRSLLYGQVAVKVADLVRIQIDLKNGLDAMIPKLPDNKPVALQTRLTDIPQKAANINAKIAAITALIIPEDEEGLLTEDNYFGPKIEKIEEVRQLQSQMVNEFIDIDINYVQPKI